MIARERAHQAARELAAERDLETLAGSRLRLGKATHIGAMVDQAADGSPVIGRQDVHGTLSIVAAGAATNPWREGTTRLRSRRKQLKALPSTR